MNFTSGKMFENSASMQVLNCTHFTFGGHVDEDNKYATKIELQSLKLGDRLASRLLGAAHFGSTGELALHLAFFATNH